MGVFKAHPCGTGVFVASTPINMSVSVISEVAVEDGTQIPQIEPCTVHWAEAVIEEEAEFEREGEPLSDQAGTA